VNNIILTEGIRTDNHIYIFISIQKLEILE